MIKTVTLMARKEGWTKDEFNKHWREIHGPLAFAVKGIRRYIQSECLDQIIRKDVAGTEFQVDGVAEVWYDSQEAMMTARNSPEGQALLADGALFIGRALTLVVKEREFIPFGNRTGATD